MCGRYTLFTPREALEDRFGATLDPSFRSRYNCAPGQRLPVITNEEPDEFRFLRWGLIPSWADDRSTSFINARAETVRAKRSFADAYERRRCLVPADGFYEWTETSDGKRPYRVAFEDDRPFALAGLWERWTPPQTQTGLSDFAAGGDASEATDAEPEVVETFTIMTTEPNDLVSRLHRRMAVILSPDEEDQWLTARPDEAYGLLDPYSGDDLRAYPVSTRVNDPTNDSPDLVEAVGPSA
jgi:putative SOS response-associated peptidase YedK